MKRINSRSTLFLGEIVLALLVFALCAAVCGGLLFRAYRIGNNSRELNQAVFSAQNAAEAFKSEQNMEQLAVLLNGSAENGRCYVYYDKDWQLTKRTDAIFMLCVAPRIETGVVYADISVDKGGDIVYALESAVYIGEGER